MPSIREAERLEGEKVDKRPWLVSGMADVPPEATIEVVDFKPEALVVREVICAAVGHRPRTIHPGNWWHASVVRGGVRTPGAGIHLDGRVAGRSVQRARARTILKNVPTRLAA